MDYVNFDLEVERAEPGYRVRVDSPVGSMHEDLKSPFELPSVEQFLNGVGRSNRAVTRDLSPVESVEADIEHTTTRVGTQLFEAFLPGNVKVMLRRSLDKADGEDKGLRLRLRLTDVPELTLLPWEFLYDPDNRRFFTLYTETPLVRYPELPQPVDSRSVTPPFKVLVAIACPPRYGQLDVDREWQDLKEALAELESRRLVEVKLLEDATARGLQDQLRREDPHVFHFIGHGDFDQEDQEGFLVMEDEAKLTMNELGTLLREKRRTLRLVILNACKGARSSPGDPFSGLAQRLIQEQIPAVIAMQMAISDPAAIAFAGEFYRSLAEGYPLEGSLAWARKAIYLQGNRLEWGTPVLFLRSDHGRVFEVPAEHRPVRVDLAVPPDEQEEGHVALVHPPRKVVDCFVDREKQFDGFLKMIGGQTSKQIMFVEAPEEMGKTWLIGRLLHECLDRGLSVARIDFRDGKWDHIDIVSKARSQLGTDHFSKMTQLMDEHKDLFDEARASQSLAQKLMDAFFEDLRVLSRARAVLLFDSYEESPKPARDWLCSILLTEIRDGRLPGMVVVLAGHEVPALRADWQAEIARTDLACFDDFYKEKYLALERVSAPIQPQSMGPCAEGEYRPGDLANEVISVKGDWL
jgi:hypothetical protein